MPDVSHIGEENMKKTDGMMEQTTQIEKGHQGQGRQGQKKGGLPQVAELAALRRRYYDLSLLSQKCVPYEWSVIHFACCSAEFVVCI